MTVHTWNVQKTFMLAYYSHDIINIETWSCFQKPCTYYTRIMSIDLLGLKGRH